jgi:chloride channel protein, CIC family
MPRGTRPDGPGAKYRDVGVGRFGFTKTLLGTIIASSVGFGIYFAIAGAVFLGIYKVPQYRFEDWQLLAGVLLGWFAAVVVTVLASQ